LGGSLHVLRRTLATDMYDNGAPIKQIASYIGDSEATTEKYYIAVRKKIISEGKVTQIVPDLFKGGHRKYHRAAIEKMRGLWYYDYRKRHIL
jgi:hypothetical protein